MKGSESRRSEDDRREACGAEFARQLRVNRLTIGHWRRRILERRRAALRDEPRPGAPRQISDAAGDISRDRTPDLPGISPPAQSRGELPAVPRSAVRRESALQHPFRIPIVARRRPDRSLVWCGRCRTPLTGTQRAKTARLRRVRPPHLWREACALTRSPSHACAPPRRRTSGRAGAGRTASTGTRGGTGRPGTTGDSASR